MEKLCLLWGIMGFVIGFPVCLIALVKFLRWCCDHGLMYFQMRRTNDPNVIRVWGHDLTK